MVAVLDELDLTRLVTTIPGLTAVGAAVILAQTGDPARYDTPAPGSNMPVLRRRPTSPASTAEGPATPAAGAPGCAPRPGGRSGARFAATRSTPPGTPS
jgi:hypothetical protein